LQRVLNAAAIDPHFREDLGEVGHNNIHQFEEERLVETEIATVPDGASQDSAQDVAAAFVRRSDTVGNREAQTPDVIGDYAEGNITGILQRAAVFLPGELFQFAED